MTIIPFFVPGRVNMSFDSLMIVVGVTYWICVFLFYMVTWSEWDNLRGRDVLIAIFVMPILLPLRFIKFMFTKF